ncbi:MAG: hypothetical protein OXF43_01890 [Gammaproteobacteria bacterium]|nr:hypothetical protein [Gammaproteobacteria bacterium]
MEDEVMIRTRTPAAALVAASLVFGSISGTYGATDGRGRYTFANVECVSDDLRQTVQGYFQSSPANSTQKQRWARVLEAFGEQMRQTPMRAVEGINFNNLRGNRWVEVSEALICIERQAALDWFQNAGYGVWFHWTTHTKTDDFVGPEDHPDNGVDWNDQVNGFDVDTFSQNVLDVGASYIIMSVAHIENFFPFPNATIDRLIENSAVEFQQPDRTSNRDLLLELHDKLNPHGVEIILYWATQGRRNEDYDFGRALGWDTRSSDSQWYRNTQQIVESIGEQYGDGIFGWWFDNFYHWDLKEAGMRPSQAYIAHGLNSWVESARRGNPGRLVALNLSGTEYSDALGAGTYDAVAAGIADYVGGEIGSSITNNPPLASFIELENPLANSENIQSGQLLNHRGLRIDTDGCCWWFSRDGDQDNHSLLFSNLEIIDKLKEVRALGGVPYTFNIAPRLNGHWYQPSLDQLKIVKEVIRNGKEYIPDSSPALQYDSDWNKSEQIGASDGELHASSVSGSSASFVFVGTGVELFTRNGPDGGLFDIYLDGRRVRTDFDSYSPTVDYQVPAYSVKNLSLGRHEIELKVKGRNPQSSGNWAHIDHLLYQP